MGGRWADVHYNRGEVMDAQAMVYFNLRLALCPISTCRRKAKDVRKLLMVRKEGSYTTEETRLYYTGSRAPRPEGRPRQTGRLSQTLGYHGVWGLLLLQVTNSVGQQVLGGNGIGGVSEYFACPILRCHKLHKLTNLLNFGWLACWQVHGYGERQQRRTALPGPHVGHNITWTRKKGNRYRKD